MVFEKLKRIICDYFEIDDDEFVSDASLTDDFGLDELDLADLSMDVEDNFEVELSEEALENIAETTLQNAMDCEKGRDLLSLPNNVL